MWQRVRVGKYKKEMETELELIRVWNNRICITRLASTGGVLRGCFRKKGLCIYR